MARNVLVDVSNLLTNINKGNEAAAKEMVSMRASGVNLFYDEQGFRESVTNNAQAIESQANRQTLEDLGFKPAPVGANGRRFEFHALNSAGGNAATIQDGAGFQKNPDQTSDQKKLLVDSKGLGNLRDAALGATAYANDFEILSLDSSFASPGERQNQLNRAFTRTIETRKENAAAGGAGTNRTRQWPADCAREPEAF